MSEALLFLNEVWRKPLRDVKHKNDVGGMQKQLLCPSIILPTIREGFNGS
jgi:hypothetical protein